MLLARFLPWLKAVLRSLGLLPYAKRFAAAVSGQTPYFLKVALEQANYADVQEVHDLPSIHHYWADKHLLPELARFGFTGTDEFFANHVERSLVPGRTSRILSVGAGNCDAEVRIAGMLHARGARDFTIECLDINPAMLERGRQLATQQGRLECIVFTRGDFNRWRPAHEYEAVIANQALHHVLELEHLLDSIKAAIGARGRLIVSDMIGRNGHQRWPEALAIVQEFWRELPAQYRYNRQQRRQEDTYLDWDCSAYGFEGVRAQDILPLLVQRFRFEVFLPFGNVIDPFIDRGFGGNFDPAREWDRDFIDRVHARDQAEIIAGRIKPTHMFAVLQAGEPAEPRFWHGLRPEACVRAT